MHGDPTAQATAPPIDLSRPLSITLPPNLEVPTSPPPVAHVLETVRGPGLRELRRLLQQGAIGEALTHAETQRASPAFALGTAEIWRRSTS